MQFQADSLTVILSPLELAVCQIVSKFPGVTSRDIKAELSSGAYSGIGVSTGHYSRISMTLRRLYVAKKIDRRPGKRDTEMQPMGRVPYSYFITPQGEAAVQNTTAFRGQLASETKEE